MSIILTSFLTVEWIKSCHLDLVYLIFSKFVVNSIVYPPL